MWARLGIMGLLGHIFGSHGHVLGTLGHDWLNPPKQAQAVPEHAQTWAHLGARFTDSPIFRGSSFKTEIPLDHSILLSDFA